MVSYAVKVRTDPVQFMQLIKKESIGSYVMSQLSCVSPFTLLGLKDVFKSVLQSKFPPEADRVKDTPLHVRAVLGPWARVTVARLRGVLRELGFSKVYPLAELPGARAHFSGPHQACIGERYDLDGLVGSFSFHLTGVCALLCRVSYVRVRSHNTGCT
jgi:hypothetical protein